MIGTLQRARRKLGAVRRRIFESPERAAWRRAWHRSETTPRHTPGRIRMLDYDIQYADLMNLCPQWDDIFVRGALNFRTTSAAPRILDCGANLGLASLYFKRAYPKARITAFEADPTLFEMLRGNLSENGASDVEAVHAAVWTTDGTLTFNCEGTDSGMVGSLPGAVDGPAVQVPSIRLRELLSRERVDLLKLDIEGAEAQVLADCGTALSQVSALIIEVHEFDAAKRQMPGILEGLRQAGLTYAVDDFVALSWREPHAGADSPFPGRPMIWAMTVRAWRATS